MKNYEKEVTYEDVITSVKNALFEIKQIKPEDIFSYVLLTDYGVTTPEVKKLIQKVAEYFEFSDKLDENAIGYFFGQQDWKTLTVHQFTEYCIDLVVFEVLEDL